MICLLEMAGKNKSLRVLDISNNMLSDIIAPNIAKMLKSCSLYELYLHWNLFRAEGGGLIFASLSEND